jgi:hypothetical protein
MLGVEAQMPSKIAFLSAQLFVGKFLNHSAVLADHEAMATLCGIQAALHKSAAGQHFVSQIEATKQTERAVDGNMVEIFAPGAQSPLYIVG